MEQLYEEAIHTSIYRRCIVLFGAWKHISWEVNTCFTLPLHIA